MANEQKETIANLLYEHMIDVKVVGSIKVISKASNQASGPPRTAQFAQTTATDIAGASLNRLNEAKVILLHLK